MLRRRRVTSTTSTSWWTTWRTTWRPRQPGAAPRPGGRAAGASGDRTDGCRDGPPVQPETAGTDLGAVRAGGPGDPPAARRAAARDRHELGQVRRDGPAGGRPGAAGGP